MSCNIFNVKSSQKLYNIVQTVRQPNERETKKKKESLIFIHASICEISHDKST